MNDTPHRLLIVRLTALGDVIHGVPVLNALRDRFAETHLAWVVEGRNAEVIEGHPAVDELIRAPRRWYKSPREIFALRRRLIAGRFDTTVDLQCLTKSATLAWLTGAKRRIGADGTDGRELSKWFNNQRTLVNAEHVIDHYLGILQPLGIDKPAVRFDLPESEADQVYAQRLLTEGGLTPRRFAVLNPGAGWPSKIWPAERYGELAQRLRDEHGLSSLAVWGGKEEQPLADEIVATSHGAAKLAPPTSIPQLGAVCRRAALFVGSDTGPMHLSVAVGTPTLSLHGASQAAWCGAYGPLGASLQAEYTEGSYGQRRRADNSAMRAIHVERVAQTCGELLSRPRAAAA